MNQILFNKKKNKKIKYMLKVQLVIILVIITGLIFKIFNSYNKDKNLENISQTINKNFKITSIYSTQKINKSEEIYIGKIYIDKIELEYSIFNDFDDEKLKISPCKFHGTNIGEKGNLCIAGHNYNDNRFFSRLDELEIGDKIVLEDLNNNKFEYIVFEIFETHSEDLSILNSSKNYELTLLTCNNSNKNRIIVKAYMKEY